jgi:hypothetical protein
MNQKLLFNPSPIVFVFGSNQAGRHGKGAALVAKNTYGAIYGVGSGRTGNAYAIPTKDYSMSPLPIEAIKVHVDNFVEYANLHPELTFRVTKVGCGLARYQEALMVPLFKGCPKNCLLPLGW